MTKGRTWTKEEILYLDDTWGTKPIKSIAEKLNRSESAIIQKAGRRNLGPFLESGNYITFNQFMKYIGYDSISYKLKSWIEKRNLRIKNKTVGKNKFKVIYIEDFWKWADKNRQFVDWNKVKKNSIENEPEWVEKLRKNQKSKFSSVKWTKKEENELLKLIFQYKYTYKQISEKLNRSEGAILRKLIDLKIKARPLRKPAHSRNYNDKDLEYIKKSILEGKIYRQMTEHVGKSEKAIRGFLYRKYGTENLDKLRNKIIEEKKEEV